MTISNKKVLEYQDMTSRHLGIEITFEQAKIEALHLLRIFKILRSK